MRIILNILGAALFCIISATPLVGFLMLSVDFSKWFLIPAFVIGVPFMLWWNLQDLKKNPLTKNIKP